MKVNNKLLYASLLSALLLASIVVLGCSGEATTEMFTVTQTTTTTAQAVSVTTTIPADTITETVPGPTTTSTLPAQTSTVTTTLTQSAPPETITQAVTSTVTVTPIPENQIAELLSPQEAYDLIQANLGNPKFFNYDLREPGNYDAGHIEGAINLPFSGISASYFRDKDRCATYLISAGADYMRGEVMDMMKLLGFCEVYNLDGGLSIWIANGFPLVQ